MSAFMKTLQRCVVQGRMFDGIQDIVTRHLGLLHEKFMRYFPNNTRDTEHIAWLRNP